MFTNGKSFYLCNLKSVAFINTIFKWYHSIKSQFYNNISISIYYYSTLFRCNGRDREEKQVYEEVPAGYPCTILIFRCNGRVMEEKHVKEKDPQVSGRRNTFREEDPEGYPWTIYNSTLIRCNGRVREKRIQRGIPVQFIILLHLDAMAGSGRRDSRGVSINYL